MNEQTNMQKFIYKDVHFSINIIMNNGNPQSPLADDCLSLSIPLRICAPSHICKTYIWLDSNPMLSSHHLPFTSCTCHSKHTSILAISQTGYAWSHLKVFELAVSSARTPFPFTCTWFSVSQINISCSRGLTTASKTVISAPLPHPLTLLCIFFFT